MGVLSNLTEEIKNAMRAKDAIKLESLRAIKSAVLLVQTASGGGNELPEEEAIQLLQKLVKQRKDSAAIFKKQNRPDLAEPEEKQAKIIAAFLPEQLDQEAVQKAVEKIISETGASGMKDMGKVMGMASKTLAGKADGKTISTIVKQILTS
jgi:uncharacterized protein YqeY